MRTYAAFAAVLVASYFMFGGVGYSLTSPVYTHFVYMFSHCNIFHLLGNVFAILYMGSIFPKYIVPAEMLLFSYISAVACSFASSYELPTMGVSGMSWFFVGVIQGFVPAKYYKVVNKKVYFGCWVLLVLQFILFAVMCNNINNLLHIECFALGFFYILWRKKMVNSLIVLKLSLHLYRVKEIKNGTEKKI